MVAGLYWAVITSEDLIPFLSHKNAPSGRMHGRLMPDLHLKTRKIPATIRRGSVQESVAARKIPYDRN